MRDRKKEREGAGRGEKKSARVVHITEKYRTMFYGVDFVIKCVCDVVVAAAFFALAALKFV